MEIELLDAAAPIEIIDHQHHGAVGAYDGRGRRVQDLSEIGDEHPVDLEHAARHARDQTGDKQDRERPAPRTSHQFAAAAQRRYSEAPFYNHDRREQRPTHHEIDPRDYEGEKREGQKHVEQQESPDDRNSERARRPIGTANRGRLIKIHLTDGDDQSGIHERADDQEHQHGDAGENLVALA